MLTWFATGLARGVRWLVQVSGRGQGSSLPGLVALKISPGFLKKRARHIGGPIIVVTGTNGKTTTCSILSNILRESGYDVVTNAAGANMPSGVATALAMMSKLRAKKIGANNVVAKKKRVAVIEADEHALPQILAQLPAATVVLTNLFRDQLDRYGEIDSIAKRWEAAITGSKSVRNVVANAHDARVITVARSVKKQSIYFGVRQLEILGNPNPNAADVSQCPSCGGRLDGTRFIAHLGILRCANCTFTTPEPTIVLTRYQPKGFDGAQLEIVRIKGTEENKLGVETGLLGRYNAFNILAAVAAAETIGDTDTIGVADTAIVRGIAKTVKVFGRSESFVMNNRDVLLHLAKNPTGYNEILQLLDESSPKLSLVLALNDNWADGEDISWIWDVLFEAIAPKISALTVTGKRAGDLAVRLETAGVTIPINVEENLITALEGATTTDTLGHVESDVSAVGVAGSTGAVHIISSYTAMIFLRGELARRDLVPANWEPAL